MTPAPPEGFKIIPRAYLEAGNPLPEDAIVWNGVLKCWIEAELAGCPTGVIRPYATAQPLPCFQSPDQGQAARIAELLTPEASELADIAVARMKAVLRNILEGDTIDYRSIEAVLSDAPVAVQSPDQGPEQPVGYWWCPNCKEEVGAYHVTYQEKHESCGHSVEWITPKDKTPEQRIAELERENARRCEHCGSHHVIDFAPGCPFCGAPNCCQVCCKTSRLESELTQLRATIETLTRERDEARAANSQLTAALNNSSRTMELAGKEIDALRAQLAASEKNKAALNEAVRAIEEAPHEATCNHDTPAEFAKRHGLKSECDCWKQTALARINELLK